MNTRRTNNNNNNINKNNNNEYKKNQQQQQHNNRVSRIFTMGSFGVTMEQVYDQCQKHNDQPTMQGTGML